VDTQPTVSKLSQHEIAEASHRILNPFTDEKLMQVGRIIGPGADTRILDLACGKGELLCRWAETFGISGVGIDLSEVFLAAARARAEELGVSERVGFELGDAAAFELGASSPYDVVSCVGATWIGGGLTGTIDLMRPAVATHGLLLVGEPYWVDPPPAEAYEAMSMTPDDFASLEGTLDRFESAGVELVEMVLADGGSWDRYAASQWWTVDRWLRANPDDDRADAMRMFLRESRRSHLAYQRRYLGWGVFVLKPGAA
jgi:SAM-dependent methyltransferase